jgi:hypothetical protein
MAAGRRRADLAAMPGLVQHQRPIEYAILHHPRPDGGVIGSFADHPIFDAVVDEWGRRFEFAGVAPRRRDGQFDPDLLRKGEFIVQPGLIYRLRPGK